MEQGLANKYGSGEGQNTSHYYAGTIKEKKVSKKKNNKRK